MPLSLKGGYIQKLLKTMSSPASNAADYMKLRNSVAHLVFVDPNGKIIISIGFSTGNDKHICKFKVMLNTKLCQGNLVRPHS